MEYVRNRKIVQIIIENRKTEINFDQSRKPPTLLEKTCTRLRLSEVHIFRGGNRKKHQTASNSKSKNLILILPKTENREANRTETAIVTKTEKRKFFLAQKPKNRSEKLPKPKIPISSSVLLCSEGFSLQVGSPVFSSQQKTKFNLLCCDLG